MLFLMLLLGCTVPFDGEVGPIVNLWLEAMPGTSAYMDQIADERGYQCFVFQDDGRSFLKSDQYGVEGPYDWCWDSPNSIQTDTVSFELESVGPECWDARIDLLEYGVEVDGLLIPCFSDDLDLGLDIRSLQSLPDLQCP